MDMLAFIEGLKARTGLGTFAWHQLLRPIEAKYGSLKLPLSPKLRQLLETAGIKNLYCHQAESLDAIRDGKNLVVMTPTASGKSLIYNLAALESVLDDPSSRSLYVFPLKALAEDQLARLKTFGAPLGMENLAAVYDGDTKESLRKKIRDNPPNILITNPDMLHHAILPHHDAWAGFFKNLKHVVIDEVHAYRGVFGSHVAHVLRRLRRVAESHGSRPIFIACSATIANPVELAETLVSAPFESAVRVTARQGFRHFIFLDPADSPYTAATRLFIESVRTGFKTIAFTKARKITELMHGWAKKSAPEISKSICSYRSGFLPEERRGIEARLRSGELSGVISTSALELGMDIGSLDVCLLVGYPGTISSTWQRAGRVGRAGSDALIVMVAIEDALDKHFIRNPSDFFERNVESATLDPENPIIKKAHLVCAANELPIRDDDVIYDASDALSRRLLGELEREGKARRLLDRDRKSIWCGRVKRPERHVNIRGAGAPLRILDENGTLLGLSAGNRALRELHPGAIYLHMGAEHIVLSLHLRKREAVCRQVEVDFYTTPSVDEETEIVEEFASRRVGNVEVKLGRLRVTETVTGYWRKDAATRKPIAEFRQELPPVVFETVGVWMKVDEELVDEVKKLGFDAMGGLHALEHAQIAALPLFALCDRADLGGVSYSFNPKLQSPAIFVYDGAEGGVGLTRRGFDAFKEWLEATLELLGECPCEISCPSCTQDPMCGNGNSPLDKRAAMHILKCWLGKG
jgi:DEAD/DEAH box helicase domain-containing protein